MGKASSSKKVARAATTGGGRTGRGRRPWAWYLSIGLVVVLGVGIIAVSRDQRKEELAAGASSEPPLVNRDHWHAAYGIYVCDRFLGNIQSQRDPKGIHTHADGVIHIHPFVRSAAGRNATLGVFADAVGMKLSDSRVKIGSQSWSENKTKCDGKLAQLQVKVNDQLVVNDIRGIRLQDRDLITIAMVPRGADIPPPPSAPNLNNLSDVPGGGATSTVPLAPPTTAGEQPPATEPPTTAPPG
jgi:hypothetical protein